MMTSSVVRRVAVALEGFRFLFSLLPERYGYTVVVVVSFLARSMWRSSREETNQVEKEAEQSLQFLSMRRDVKGH